MILARNTSASLALVLLFLSAAPSCSLPTDPTDVSVGYMPCQQGDNMTNPRLAAGLEGGTANPRVRIIWERGTSDGAKLPASYFDRFDIQGADRSVVSKAEHTAPSEITLSFVDLSMLPSGKRTLKFSLGFEDRRDFIDGCSHPAMPDMYLLDVTLQLDQNLSIVSSQFTQRVSLGDF